MEPKQARSVGLAPFPEGEKMEWDGIERNWLRFSALARERWPRLGEDELARIAGSREQLIGLLQERYGWEREEAERDVRNWRAGLSG